MKKILSSILILCLMMTLGVSVFADQRLVISRSGEFTVLTEVINNSYGYFETPFMKIRGSAVTTWNESRYIPGFGDIPLYVVEVKGECTIFHCNNEISVSGSDGYIETVAPYEEADITLPVGTYTLSVNIGGDGTEVKLYVTSPSPAPASPVSLPEASVTLNGSPLILDQSAVITDGRVMVPARAIFEAMGLTLNWNDTTKTATAVNDEIEIVMSIDNKVAYVNGEAHVLDVPPQIINDRTLVPVRFVSESMGAEVMWDSTDNNVFITY